MAAHEWSWLLLLVDGRLWLLMAVDGRLCLPMVRYSRSWLLALAFGCVCLPMPVYVCLWLRVPAYGTMPPGNQKHALERFATYTLTFLWSCVLTSISSLPIGVSAGIFLTGCLRNIIGIR